MILCLLFNIFLSSVIIKNSKNLAKSPTSKQLTYNFLQFSGHNPIYLMLSNYYLIVYFYTLMFIGNLHITPTCFMFTYLSLHFITSRKKDLDFFSFPLKLGNILYFVIFIEMLSLIYYWKIVFELV